MKIMLVIVILFVNYSAGFSQASAYEPDHLFPTNELKEDLRFLKDSLEKKHPALYRYISKPELDAVFDSLDHAIACPLNEQEFLSLVTLLHASIKDGHTIFLPSEGAMEYLNTKERLLPLAVVIIKGKLFVAENWSGDSSIQCGEEIMNINGISAVAVLSQLLRRQIRDGQNQTYPIWILNQYFAPHYSFVYGHPERFTLGLKNAQGVFHTMQVMALKKDNIKVYRQKRYPARYLLPNDGKGIILEEKKDGVSAILTLRSFDTAMLNETYKQAFNQVIDRVFRHLQLHHIHNLILDLRGNQGGDFESGRYLLSYLFTKPSMYLVGGKESRMIQPQKNHFAGKLIVLINGGSFSNSGIVSACLEREQRAIFIGEETGGNKYVISGDPEELILPHTRISCNISTTEFRISKGVNREHGVVPGYPVSASLEDLLNERDTAMELALKLISQNR